MFVSLSFLVIVHIFVCMSVLCVFVCEYVYCTYVFVCLLACLYIYVCMCLSKYNYACVITYSPFPILEDFHSRDLPGL